MSLKKLINIVTKIISERKLEHIGKIIKMSLHSPTELPLKFTSEKSLCLSLWQSLFALGYLVLHACLAMGISWKHKMELPFSLNMCVPVLLLPLTVPFVHKDRHCQNAQAVMCHWKNIYNVSIWNLLYILYMLWCFVETENFSPVFNKTR